jgi:hypothetical protein
MNVKMFVTMLGKSSPAIVAIMSRGACHTVTLKVETIRNPTVLRRVLEYGNDNRNAANNSKGRKQKVNKANGGLK